MTELTLVNYINSYFEISINYLAEKKFKEYLKDYEDNPNYSTNAESLLKKYESNIRQNISVNI